LTPITKQAAFHVGAPMSDISLRNRRPLNNPQSWVNYCRVFPGCFFFPVRLLLFSVRICAAGRVNCGGERRAVVWPVSCLVRGRACPGGRTLVLRRPGRPCPALVCPAWPPGLARRGSRAWEVGKEPHRAAPGAGPYRRVPGSAASGVRPSRGCAHVSPLSRWLSGAPRARDGTVCEDRAARCRRASVTRGSRKQAVTFRCWRCREAHAGRGCPGPCGAGASSSAGCPLAGKGGRRGSPGQAVRPGGWPAGPARRRWRRCGRGWGRGRVIRAWPGPGRRGVRGGRVLARVMSVC
jgi:hypothetical protein